MGSDQKDFIAKIPQLDLAQGAEMLTDFSREAQRHLISARNSLLILETAPNDKESLENVFKTFHTIKGLADFLKLQDVFSLTSKVETVLDLVRKELLTLEPQTLRLTNNAVLSLQKLLELLDEQIEHGGRLQSDYHDVGALIIALQSVIEKKAAAAIPAKPALRVLPAIYFEPDMSVYQKIEGLLSTEAVDVKVEKDTLKKLLAEFQQVTRELKDAQGKLHERQRELIKERELAVKLTQQAQTEARGKSEYLANMSHEIRTLINAILGFTTLLKESPLNDKQRDHLQTITVSGKMLLEIVNDILDYSKVEAGKLKLEIVDFNLSHITEEVFKILRSRIVNKTLHLYIDFDENVPLALMGDPTRVKQVFMNLLDNAIKFTESGEVGMTVSLAPEEPPKEGWVVLQFRVQDTGIGIPEDRIAALFQSFTQAADSTTRLYGGTGLGLALCKTFVEKMGGEIDVTSQLGKGTSFNFKIPFALSQKNEAEPEKLVEITPPDPQILLVTEHEKTAQSFARIAKSLDLPPIIRAASAKQSSEMLLKIESAKGPLPIVTFIDTLLPSKEGFMLAYKIRQQEQYAKMRLVALTCDGRIEISDDYQQAGFESSLQKPVIKGEVIDVLSRVLAQTPTDHRVIAPNLLQKISCAGVRVLVVEDSLPNQELLKIHLETLGCTSDYAVNGKEAVEFLKKNTYDICFMDLQMPVMNGIEAARVIRLDLKLTIPIIALTAAEIQEEREKCFNVGMNDYLAKPFGIDDLKETIIKCTKM